MSQAANACRKGGIHARNMSSRPHTMISAISGRNNRAVFFIRWLGRLAVVSKYHGRKSYAAIKVARIANALFVRFRYCTYSSNAIIGRAFLF